MRTEFRLNGKPLCEQCSEIADLMTLVASLGNGFTYKKSQCELWIKPAGIAAWLTCAQGRDYRHARLVFHGGDQATYNGVRADWLGFSMEYAGSKNGQAHDKGLYFGLSDHVTVGYNKYSGYPNGTCIMGIMLTKDQIGWQHGQGSRHGGYDLTQDDEYGKCYHTFNLSAPIANKDNCIVVHEPALVLPIGFCVAN